MGQFSDVFKGRLASGEIIILDGAVSTELQRRGVPVDPLTWYGSANLDHLDDVQKLHEDYIRAGAEVIITNTHCTSRAGLEPAGLGERVAEINQRAVEAAIRAREAVAQKPVAIAGSISPFIPAAMGALDRTDLLGLDTFREQAELLAESGVDLLALEMMDSTRYGLPAIEASLETGLPVWLGVSPVRIEGGRLDAAEANKTVQPIEDPADPDPFAQLMADYAKAYPALDAINIMHVRFGVVSDALAIVRQFFPATTVGVYAEVGDWAPPTWTFVDFSPEQYLKEAELWAKAGVQIIGSCCGTGPEHTRALAEGLPKRVPARGGHIR